MGEVINIEELKKKLNPEKQDLTEILKRMSSLIKKDKKDEIVNPQNLRKKIEIMISEQLFKYEMISPDFFWCANYISEFLSKTAVSSPKSWFFTDYLVDKNNSKYYQEGGNVCFLICSLFRKRGDIGYMTLKDYQNMGPSLYYTFYSMSGKEIGLHMSKNFSAMAQITKESFKLV